MKIKRSEERGISAFTSVYVSSTMLLEEINLAIGSSSRSSLCQKRDIVLIEQDIWEYIKTSRYGDAKNL